MDSGCKGLFYRGINNSFINSKGHIVFKKELRFLKRMSCKGCPECGHLMDDIGESLSLECLASPDIIGGAIYRPKYANINRDFETGIVDDWDIEFKRI